MEPPPDPVVKPSAPPAPEPPVKPSAPPVKPYTWYEVLAIALQQYPAFTLSVVKPPSILTLVLITICLLIVAFIAVQIANYRNIRANWSHYRCDPSVAPFASFYGHDLTENLNFCTGEAVREHAPGVIDPIYQGIDKITGVVDGVHNQVMSIAGGVEVLLSGMRTFIMNFVNSMRLITTRARMAFIRIKDIFARVYGIFIAFAFAGISAITFGENLVCNPLVVFLGIIAGVEVCCFAPNTPIVLADGVSTKPISEIRIGDRLADGAVVESTYLFDGANTTMKRLYGIHVSANHYIQDDGGKMIHVGEHPDAEDAEELTRLWCLGTSTHRIPILSGGKRRLTFADYEESSDPAVIAETQHIAEMELNKGLGLGLGSGPTVPDYGLGLDPSFHVHMEHGKWVPIANIGIGDRLNNGVPVKGVIHEFCETQVKTPGGQYVSAAQLIHYGGVWRRAANIWPSAVENRRSTLYHLMVPNNVSIAIKAEEEVFVVRDYAEVTSLSVQAPYDTAMRCSDQSKHAAP